MNNYTKIRAKYSDILYEGRTINYFFSSSEYTCYLSFLLLSTQCVSASDSEVWHILKVQNVSNLKSK